MENNISNYHNCLLSSKAGSEIIKAMIAAKKNFLPCHFDKSGNKNKYATLKAINNATEEALSKEGLFMHQEELYCPQCVKSYLVTRILHTSEQFFLSIAPINPSSGTLTFRDKTTGEQKEMLSESQKYGCSLSFSKRYSAATILGVNADDSDEDNYHYDQPSKLPRKEIDDLMSKVNAKMAADPQSKAKIMAFAGSIRDIYDMTKEQYTQIMKIVNQ